MSRRGSLLIATSFVTMAAQAMAAEVVTVNLVGEVEKSCGLGALPGSLDLGELTASTSKEISFSVDCNAPFTVSLLSQNGGLENSSPIQRVGTFADFVPYQVSIEVPTDASQLNLSCMSSAIKVGSVTCGAADSGDAIAIGQSSRMRVSWVQPAAPALSGLFSDQLTITFSGKP